MKKTLLFIIIAIASLNVFSQTTAGYQADNMSAALASTELRAFLSNGEFKSLKSIKTIDKAGEMDLNNFIIHYDTHNGTSTLNCHVIANVTRVTSTDHKTALSEPICSLK